MPVRPLLGVVLSLLAGCWFTPTRKYVRITVVDATSGQRLCDASVMIATAVDGPFDRALPPTATSGACVYEYGNTPVRVRISRGSYREQVLQYPNGEITNPSLEVSLTGYFQFIVHKGKPLTIPRV